MSKKCNASSACSLDLRDVLLIYLQLTEGLLMPGSDGLTLEDAVACYPQAIATGLVPDKDELLRLHPDLESDLKQFFAG